MKLKFIILLSILSFHVSAEKEIYLGKVTGSFAGFSNKNPSSFTISNMSSDTYKGRLDRYICKNFQHNSEDNNITSLREKLKRGMQVTLVNAHMVKKGKTGRKFSCYYDKIILNTAQAAKSSPVSSNPKK